MFVTVENKLFQTAFSSLSLVNCSLKVVTDGVSMVLTDDFAHGLSLSI